MGSNVGGRQGQTPIWKGLTAKHISLITLTIQNSTLILLLYYSRSMPLVAGHRYFPSTAVFLNEVLKLGISITIALYEITRNSPSSTPATTLFGTLSSAVFTGDSWKLAIPAGLYTLQNTLQYVAISNLEAATMQVTYQFKIIPTAIFSVLILQRSLTTRKWLALALLMFGVAVVQMPTMGAAGSGIVKETSSHWHLPRSLEFMSWNNEPAKKDRVWKRSATYEGIQEDLLRSNPPKNEAFGLATALLGSTVAALGSVYFEKILKEQHSNVSIWVRNVQLSVYSLFPALFIGVVFVDGEAIAKNGFFTGYNWVVWTVVACQALGGIVVSLCVYYADTVTKSFATSLSILLSLCLSILFFEFTVTTNFLVGTLIVFYATYLYNSGEISSHLKVPPIEISSSDEKNFQDHGFAIKLPGTPFKDTGLTTSTPGSPALHHKRNGSNRGYFGAADGGKEK